MKSYILHRPLDPETGDYELKPLEGMNKWLEALRSNRYEQGENYLKKDNKYCCLGVLCELNQLLESHSEIPEIFCDKGDHNLTKLSVENPFFDTLGTCGYFPYGVFVEIENSIAKKTCCSLAECNDEGLDFFQIADIISQVWYDDSRD